MAFDISILNPGSAFNLVIGNAAPTVVLNSPNDAGSISDSTPTLDFTGTDPNGDAIEYQLMIENSLIPWYNSSWSYRVKVTVLASKVDADLTDYPVYVNLNNLPAGFHAHVNQTDGRDIRVTTSDGVTELPREVVFYTAASDAGELHFKASGTLSGSVDTDFYIYYGNAAASDYAVSDPYGRQNVWNSNFAIVQHMKDASTTTVADSTSSGLTGTKFAIGKPVEATGTIGTEQQGNGTDATIIGTVNDTLNINNNLTIEIWVRNLAAITGGKYVLTRRDTGGGSGDQWAIIYNFTANKYELYCEGGGPRVALTSTVLAASDTGLHYVAFTYTTSQIKGYLDGVDDVTSNGTFSIFSGVTIYRLRLMSEGTGYHNCAIDEFRVSKTTVRSATWISTTKNNLASASTFYNVGAEEPYTVLVSAVSTTDSGFANPDNGGDTHPFNSGENIQYTVQVADTLEPGTYYWKVRGTDPSGSNNYGAWSTQRSFILLSSVFVRSIILNQAVNRSYNY